MSDAELQGPPLRAAIHALVADLGLPTPYALGNLVSHKLGNSLSQFMSEKKAKLQRTMHASKLEAIANAALKHAQDKELNVQALIVKHRILTYASRDAFVAGTHVESRVAHEMQLTHQAVVNLTQAFEKAEQRHEAAERKRDEDSQLLLALMRETVELLSDIRAGRVTLPQQRPANTAVRRRR